MKRILASIALMGMVAFVAGCDPTNPISTEVKAGKPCSLTLMEMNQPPHMSKPRVLIYFDSVSERRVAVFFDGNCVAAVILPERPQ